MIEFDGTILIQIINFIVLMVVLNQILYKPIMKGILDRRKFIDGGQEKIKKQLEEVEKIQSQYKEKLDQARLVAQKLLNENISAAEKEKASILSKVLEEANQKLSESKADLEKQKQELRKELNESIEGLSENIVKKLLGGLSLSTK